MTATHGSSIKAAFVRGLFLLLPTLLTFLVLVKVLAIFQSTIGTPVTQTTLWLLSRLGVPEDAVPWDWAVTIAGLSVIVMATLVTGALLQTWVGGLLFRGVERMFARLPMINVIYPYIKQVAEFLGSEKKEVRYGGVVALEYPCQGVWAVGFRTTNGLRDIAEHTKEDMALVFVPSTPTPVTGYVVCAPVSQLHPMSITAEEATRLLVSGGVVIPDSIKSPS